MDGGLTCFFFFFNDTATTEIYTLSLHDALPISGGAAPICAAPLAALAGGTGVAGEVACPRRTYQASAMLSIAVRASALQPKPLSGSSSCAAPERFAISSCCWANFAK